MKHQGSTKSPLNVPSLKKMKFGPPTSSSGSSDVVSFGWGDFPVLLGHSGWSEFPLQGHHASQSPSPSTFAAHDELPKQTLAVCPCAFHNDPISTVVDNSKQNNCLANIIETSDSDDDIDIDVDDNSIDAAENLVVTTNPSTTQTQAQTQSRVTKRVQFTVVHVREHAVTLGDHPLAESYPISLDWAHAPVQVMRLDDFEAKKEGLLRPLDVRYIRSPRARRMTRLERRVRLERIMEVSPSTLDDKEEFRRLALRRENSCLLAGNSPCSDPDLVNDLLDMSL